MKEPTQERIEVFWKEYGFKLLPYKDVEGFGDGWVWVQPDWKYGNGKWDFKLPPIDPNSLFEYAVPKLLEDGWQVSLVSIGNIPKFNTILWQVRIDKRDNFYAQRDEDPTLALFWALDKVRRNNASSRSNE